jgi:hypothetical protein
MLPGLDKSSSAFIRGAGKINGGAIGLIFRRGGALHAYAFHPPVGPCQIGAFHIKGHFPGFGNNYFMGR